MSMFDIIDLKHCNSNIDDRIGSKMMTIIMHENKNGWELTIFC